MRRASTLAGMLVMTAMLSASLPASGTTAAYGQMSLFFPGCPADTVIAVGVNDGVAWDWALVDLNNNPGGCLSATYTVYTGPDPLVGGCGFGLLGGRLCLSGISVNGNTVHYSSVTACFDDGAVFAFCVTGSGDLTLQ